MIKPAFAAVVSAEDDKKRDPVKFAEITKDPVKIGLFFDAMEGVLPEQLQNLEKVLKVLGVDGEFIPGKKNHCRFQYRQCLCGSYNQRPSGRSRYAKRNSTLEKSL